MITEAHTIAIYYFHRSSTAQLSTWLIINLLRVIGAILGWLFVSLSPMDDEMASKSEICDIFRYQP